MLAVALRYRPLTPLFLALVIVERGLMSLQGWVLKPAGLGPPSAGALCKPGHRRAGGDLPRPVAPAPADVKAAFALVLAGARALSACAPKPAATSPERTRLPCQPAARRHAPATAGMVLIKGGSVPHGRARPAARGRPRAAPPRSAPSGSTAPRSPTPTSPAS